MPITQELEREYITARGFTLAELKQEKRCHISFRGEVYDVSKYSYVDHPGGQNVIERCRGEEIDFLLEDGIHKDIAEKLIPPLVIWVGILLDGDKATAKNENLLIELKRRSSLKPAAAPSTGSRSFASIGASVFSIFHQRVSGGDTFLTYENLYGEVRGQCIT